MSQLLKLSIQDGPQVGQTIEVPGPRCSLGGKGSDADLELSGLPYGIKFVDLVDQGKHWGLVEFEPRTVLLNKRDLKRRSKLSNGDTIWLPSTAKDQNFRLVVSLETAKKVSDGSDQGVGKINGTMLALGGAYMMMMLLVGVYFLLNPGSNNGQQVIEEADVAAAIAADISTVDTTFQASFGVPLGDSAVDFDELREFLGSSLPGGEKDEIQTEFSNRIIALFAEAWRFEKQGRWSEARTIYRRVADLMGDHDLETTALALQRMNQIRGR